MLSANIRRLYGVSISLILLSIFIAVNFETYYILALPAVLLIMGLFFLSIEYIFFIVAFCTPFSIKLMEGGSGINLPDEPLMIILLLLFVIKLAENRAYFVAILRQPLTVMIAIYLLWILVTSITSSLPIVSFKFLLARLWVIVFGYFWGGVIFKNPENIKKFLLAFGLALCLVVVYATINHYKVGFSQDKAMLVMKPLMDDHTVYGAVCSIVLIYSLILIFSKTDVVHSIDKILFSVCAVFSLTGVLLSYSRAAVLSIVFALFFAFLLKFKVRFKTVFAMLIIGLIFGAIFNNEIYQKIRFNRSTSGKNLLGDIKSISNVKNDDSNVERLNRWESGYRMFQEKPFFGFGPGTYQFKYSPYQRAHQMTSISTTKGDMGNIHSEYFGPLIESGVIGFFTIILLFGFSIATLMKLYYSTHDKEIKIFSLVVLLCFCSYYFHGLWNNFLDQDKAAVIFWGMMGIIAAISVREKSKN